MTHLTKIAAQLLAEEAGQDLIEYALLAALIALAAITCVKGLSTALNNGFASISSRMTSAM
jgi:pilus assembly protein Flp/PilA